MTNDCSQFEMHKCRLVTRSWRFAIRASGWPLLVGLCICHALPAQPPSPAQELVTNGSFEDISLNDMGEPNRDAWGHVNPVSGTWIRTANSENPSPRARLISPDNGDDPDDSRGMGTNSAAIFRNLDTQHSAWRSTAFPTVPGEELWWSFDFKIENYGYDPVNNPNGTPEGFRVLLRSFEDGSIGGSTSGGFAGELSLFVYIHGYGEDVDEDGVGDSGGLLMTHSGYPHAEQDVMVMDFEIGQWHTIDSDFIGELRTIPSVADGAPFNGNWSDWRIIAGGPRTQTNWLQVETEEFELRIDNISTLRPIDAIAGDFNGDGTVDAADYTMWRDGLGGEFDGDDYNTWRKNFGASASGSVAEPRAVTAVPEPSDWAAYCGAIVLIAARRCDRRAGQEQSVEG